MYTSTASRLAVLYLCRWAAWQTRGDASNPCKEEPVSVCFWVLRQEFYGLLVQHFALRAGARPLPLGELDALTVHLLEMTSEVGRFAGPVTHGLDVIYHAKHAATA